MFKFICFDNKMKIFERKAILHSIWAIHDAKFNKFVAKKNIFLLKVNLKHTLNIKYIHTKRHVLF